MAKLLTKQDMLEKAKTHEPVFVTRCKIDPRGDEWALTASVDGVFFARTFYGYNYDGNDYQKYVHGWVAWSDAPSDDEYKSVEWIDNRK